MLALKTDKKLALPESVMIQAIPELDHYYVFNIKNGDHFKLNRTAHWVLEAIAGGATLADLTARFANAFGISLETAETELSEVINSAMENNIIKEVS